MLQEHANSVLYGVIHFAPQAMNTEVPPRNTTTLWPPIGTGVISFAPSLAVNKEVASISIVLPLVDFSADTTGLNF